MNDTEREALRRRILERLGWEEWISDTTFGEWRRKECDGYKFDPPDHTRDANAALRDLAPLLLKCGAPYYIDDVFHDAICPDETGPLNEAVALALCLAVDALP